MDCTQHARRRCKQRAIPIAIVNLIFGLGEEYTAGRGCKIIATVSRTAKRELLAEIEAIGLPRKEHWANTYLVVAPSQTVITVGYRYGRLKQEYSNHQRISSSSRRVPTLS